MFVAAGDTNEGAVFVAVSCSGFGAGAQEYAVGPFLRMQADAAAQLPDCRIGNGLVREAVRCAASAQKCSCQGILQRVGCVGVRFGSESEGPGDNMPCRPGRYKQADMFDAFRRESLPEQFKTAFYGSVRCAAAGVGFEGDGGEAGREGFCSSYESAERGDLCVRQCAGV